MSATVLDMLEVVKEVLKVLVICPTGARAGRPNNKRERSGGEKKRPRMPPLHLARIIPNTLTPCKRNVGVPPFHSPQHFPD